MSAHVVVHSDPQILSGTPVFVGTRVPLRILFEYPVAGDSLEDCFDAFASFSKDRWSPFSGFMHPGKRCAFSSMSPRPGTSAGQPHRRCYSATMLGQTEKQLALQALGDLPDDATLEDAIDRLCFLAKIEEGIRQSDAGELISQEEIKKQFLS